MDQIIEWTDLGMMPYREAWGLQEDLRSKRVVDLIGNRFLFVEHPPVFTLGRRECGGDFISSVEEIGKDGIEIVKTNRGGRVTYHGPGQIVGYFICKLDSLGLGVKNFVRAVEEVCLRTLGDFGVGAARDPNHPGLWIGTDKIAAIGFNIERGVTQHGFALSVNCDPKPYRHIIACGIKGRGVTSLAGLLKDGVPAVSKIKRHILNHISNVFGVELKPA